MAYYRVAWQTGNLHSGITSGEVIILSGIIDLEKEFRIDLGTTFTYPARKAEIRFNYAIIDNYTDFDADCSSFTTHRRIINCCSYIQKGDGGMEVPSVN